MPDTDHVSIIRWRDPKKEPPPERTISLVRLRNGWVGACTRSISIWSTPHGYPLAFGYFEQSEVEAWTPLPSDQRLTVGDVLSVCEDAKEGQESRRRDALHEGPSKAAYLRKLATEGEEAAMKLRAAVSE